MSDYKRHNFKKLKIWQMAMEIAKTVLDVTDTFPLHEKYGLKNQMDDVAYQLQTIENTLQTFKLRKLKIK